LGKLKEKQAAERAGLQQKMADVRQRIEEVQNDPTARAAADRLESYQVWIERGQKVGTPVAGVVLFVLGIVLGLLCGLSQWLRRAVPYCLVSSLCGLVLLGITFYGWLGQEDKQRVALNDEIERHRGARTSGAVMAPGDPEAAMPPGGKDAGRRAIPENAKGPE